MPWSSLSRPLRNAVSALRSLNSRCVAGFAVLICWADPSMGAGTETCHGALVYLASSAEGAGAGIVGARMDLHSGRLCRTGVVAALDDADWLVADPRRSVLYSTSEIRSAGAPSAFAFGVDRHTGALRPINAAMTGGTGAAYLALDRQKRTLLVAHWGSGHVGALPIARSGGLSAATSIEPTRGVGPGRTQESPRTHAVIPDPGGRFILATNFSGDQILVYRYDETLGRLTSRAPAVALPPGSGPRHLLFHPNGRVLYVIEQLSSRIDTFRWSSRAGTLRLIGTVSTLSPTFTGQNDAAALIVSRDGRFLYASNRGEDTIVAYALDAASGMPAEVQRISSGGRTPRALTLDPSGKWLLAANQGANEEVVFARAIDTGRLSPTSERLAMPKSAGAIFFPP